MVAGTSCVPHVVVIWYGVNMRTSTLAWVVVIIVIIAGIAFALTSGKAPTAPQPVAVATYVCSGGKTIVASYYDGETTSAPSPDQPPTPGGSVALAFDDGSSMKLAQTISADGARYANADESIVFWNKGNGVTFTQNGQQTYMGCLAIADDSGGLPNVYENGTEGFSLRYPANFTVDDTYQYQEMGPGKSIGGVKFTIDSAIAKGTNLANDTYLSIEEVPQATSTCSADLFLDLGQGGTVSTLDDNGTTYSVASSTGAGAGNRYEEWVYAMPGTNPCMAIRYFIHYGVFENYPAGTVQQFDEASLRQKFDSIRRTLIIAQ